MNGLVVDLFAGGGGASTGIARAIGRDPDIAVNHDAAAIACHRANHPATKHYQEDIFAVDPREACAGRPVGLLWASPEVVIPAIDPAVWVIVGLFVAVMVGEIVGAWREGRRR